jgi:hypothetical protein
VEWDHAPRTFSLPIHNIPRRDAHQRVVVGQRGEQPVVRAFAAKLVDLTVELHLAQVQGEAADRLPGAELVRAAGGAARLDPLGQEGLEGR